MELPEPALPPEPKLPLLREPLVSPPLVQAGVLLLPLLVRSFSFPPTEFMLPLKGFFSTALLRLGVAPWSIPSHSLRQFDACALLRARSSDSRFYRQSLFQHGQQKFWRRAPGFFFARWFSRCGR